MITRHTRGAITWVDLECPTAEELGSIMQEFNIDPRVEEEIASPTPYPLTLATSEYLYLILHFPAAEPSQGTRDQEVDFIVGKHFLITARYEVIQSIVSLHKMFEAEELIGIPEGNEETDAILERVLRGLYAALHAEIERAGYSLDHVERAIFSGKERETVRTISNIGRVLLRFETALARHTDPLTSFLEYLGTPEFFGKRFKGRAAHIEAEHDHAAALVSSYRAVMRELRITNDSLLSSSQNEVMKTLSIMAFIAVPLTVVASIFGMNIDNMPFVHQPHAFWSVLGIMAVTGLVFFLFFRLKHWL